MRTSTTKADTRKHEYFVHLEYRTYKDGDDERRREKEEEEEDTRLYDPLGIPKEGRLIVVFSLNIKLN